MRLEVLNWFKQAEKDLEKAVILLKNRSFDGTAFYSQQTAEKALKAVILFKKEDKAEGHSLIYLGKEARIPEFLFPPLKKLSPQYVISRYPDVSDDLPSDLYDEELAKEFLETARKVLEWTKKQLKL
ncbi:HEPN domain-containing protein [Candidatus Woesearchaeota archaeon]|nr:HEPN domain-containing protein [Candidatus Woesearchaeota archaeon]